MAGRGSRRQTLYLLHVVPGLEEIAGQEIAACCHGADVVRTIQRFDQRTSLLVIAYDGSPDHLLNLGTVEDVFLLVAESETVPSNRAGLGAIRTALASSTLLDRSAALAQQVRPQRGKTTYRVISRKAGDHAYRRVDVQRAAELGLQDRFPAWRLVEDDAQREVWVTLVGSLLLVGIRISDASLRYRTYRVTSLPAALKPTIARAMVRLSDPRQDDVFLDPMCGSGTIIIERALAGRYRLLLGGDLAIEAVQATRDNIGPRYQPVEIQCWDARTLPLEEDSVSAIVCNLPFGKQIGSMEGNQTLYPALLTEWARVLQPGGSMVLLTSERALLRRALEQQPAMRMERQVPVLVRGMQAAISVLRNTDTSKTCRT